MKVLVTGAGGFVGRHVVEELIGAGHSVIAAEREATESQGAGASTASIRLELLDRNSIRDAIQSTQPEAVIHLAAISSVGFSWSEPELTFRTNALASAELMLEFAALPPLPQGPRPLILVGSGEVYGRTALEYPHLTEHMPIRPYSPYAASKAAQEMVGLGFGGGSDAIRTVLTRSFNQIGPGQRPPFFLPDWTIQLLRIRQGEAEPVLRVGNIDIARDFTDVRDVAAAYLHLLEDDEAEGIFNVCSGEGVALREILRRLMEIIGVEAEVKEQPSRLRPTDLPSLVGDPGRLSGFGWTRRFSLTESIADLVADLEGSGA